MALRPACSISSLAQQLKLAAAFLTLIVRSWTRRQLGRAQAGTKSDGIGKDRETQIPQTAETTGLWFAVVDGCASVLNAAQFARLQLAASGWQVPQP